MTAFSMLRVNGPLVKQISFHLGRKWKDARRKNKNVSMEKNIRDMGAIRNVVAVCHATKRKRERDLPLDKGMLHRFIQPCRASQNIEKAIFSSVKTIFFLLPKTNSTLIYFNFIRTLCQNSNFRSTTSLKHGLKTSNINRSDSFSILWVLAVPKTKREPLTRLAENGFTLVYATCNGFIVWDAPTM